MANWSLELQHEGYVAGIDEVGRGPWAGPVVACAVTLQRGASLPPILTDSKKLSAVQREKLYTALTALCDKSQCYIGLGEASVEEIDRINILQATHLAMQRAFDALQAQCPHTIQHALVDGNRLPALPCPTTAIVKGDAISVHIAAASIIAKVTRDRMMAKLAHTYPHYGWETNAGYGTATHQHGIRTAGITPHHRRSFRPIKEAIHNAA